MGWGYNDMACIHQERVVQRYYVQRLPLFCHTLPIQQENPTELHMSKSSFNSTSIIINIVPVHFLVRSLVGASSQSGAQNELS